MTNKKQNYNPPFIMKKRNGEYEVNRAGVYRFLDTEGFRRYNMNPASKVENWVLVQLKGNIVERVSVDYLSEACSSQIARYRDPKVREAVSNSFLQCSGLFAEQNLTMLPKLEDRFVTDTKEMGYVFFNNGAFIIHADAEHNPIHCCPYEELNGYVWGSHIIDHNLVLEETFYRQSVMEMFCEDVTRVDSINVDAERFNSLKSILGYLLHRYKDPANTKAILLMDARVSDTPTGGTGKGILISALSRMRNLAREDGKTFNLKGRFSLSQIDFDTALVVLDDVQKDFDFEMLFV